MTRIHKNFHTFRKKRVEFLEIQNVKLHFFQCLCVANLEEEPLRVSMSVNIILK